MVGESDTVMVLPLSMPVVFTAATCKPLKVATPANSVPGVASWLISCAHGPPVAAWLATHDADADGWKAIMAATMTLPCVTEVMNTLAVGYAVVKAAEKAAWKVASWPTYSVP